MEVSRPKYTLANKARGGEKIQKTVEIPRVISQSILMLFDLFFSTLSSFSMLQALGFLDLFPSSPALRFKPGTSLD